MDHWEDPRIPQLRQAQFQLGRCYASGYGNLPLKPSKAQALLRKASAQGHAKAMEELKELEKGGKKYGTDGWKVKKWFFIGDS